jgi:hypothetical protein
MRARGAGNLFGGDDAERVVLADAGGVMKGFRVAVLLQQVQRTVEQVADVIGEVGVHDVAEALL